MSHPSGPTRRATAVALALGALLLAGCSADDDAADIPDAAPAVTAETSTSAAAPASPGSSSPAEGESESETITATEGEMYIELSEDSFSPGEYTIEVVNEGSATHDLVVERDGADVARTETIAPGGTATLTVTLEEGDYVFYCSVGNHRAMGMEVPVTVTG
ncbi:hypothetical protein E4P41_03310 [Geodermatophilus sp. DF01-2]|uniref:cupredoxin domain-containing protein n=1 Tax=Geodermatophilus sp. DF01-2 TaxID=2559610 RepID=UPI001073C58D|nr:plastocyanin/azurin family copper-binding protein [Geodermatophilus sp. DF01_2]TFV63764.1 hypothetical protein E4P41_03310 [Geodermatophilus sp. DF01_2]